jgi:hypothetical protein
MKRLELRLARSERIERLRVEFLRTDEANALRYAARLQIPSAEARALFLRWSRWSQTKKAGRA